MTTRRDFCRLAAASMISRPAFSQDSLPNIVYVLADDLGWGDLRCYNPESAMPAPNASRLAGEGVRFTDRL